jgi:hypothetical protein
MSSTPAAGSSPATSSTPAESSEPVETNAPAMSSAPATSSEPTAAASTPPAPTNTPSGECSDTGAAENFSFFVTSYHHIKELSGSEDGFGGDLRYNGAATGLEGADAICQEIARRVCFGHRTWRAFLSTSTVNAKDRIGTGPWYDYAGLLVSNDVEGLLSGDRPAGGACDTGTYDETGVFHDGKSDVNNDGVDDDDHDTMTATNADGTYAGFSCDDWTSKTATDASGGTGMTGGGMGGMGGLSGGIMMGHSWPAGSGRSWSTSHGGHQCAAGTNFIQNGGGDSSTVGGGGGYGGFYCFALPE